MIKFTLFCSGIKGNKPPIYYNKFGFQIKGHVIVVILLKSCAFRASGHASRVMGEWKTYMTCGRGRGLQKGWGE